MQQTVFNFDQAEAQPVRTLKERMSETSRVINQWLNGRSEFYSRIAEFDVTRRTVIRVNLVTAFFIIAAMSVEQAPVAATAAAVSAGWIVYRANRNRR